jgi:hypothetical protein
MWPGGTNYSAGFLGYCDRVIGARCRRWRRAAPQDQACSRGLQPAFIPEGLKEPILATGFGSVGSGLLTPD